MPDMGRDWPLERKRCYLRGMIALGHNGTGQDWTHTNTRRAHRNEDRFMVAVLGAERFQESTSRDIAAPDVRLERLPVLLCVGVCVANRGQ